MHDKPISKVRGVCGKAVCDDFTCGGAMLFKVSGGESPYLTTWVTLGHAEKKHLAYVLVMHLNPAETCREACDTNLCLGKSCLGETRTALKALYTSGRRELFHQSWKSVVHAGTLDKGALSKEATSAPTRFSTTLVTFWRAYARCPAWISFFVNSAGHRVRLCIIIIVTQHLDSFENKNQWCQ